MFTQNVSHPLPLRPGLPHESRKWPLPILLAITAFLLFGCASVTATRTKPDDYTTQGIRYWLPQPFLLVKEAVLISEEESFWRFNTAEDKLEKIGESVHKLAAAPVPAPKLKTSERKKADRRPADTEPPEKDEPESGKQTSGPIEIVFLPDYCEQYAIRMDSQFASVDANITFSDGWKLLGLDSKADSTQIVAKMLEVVAAVKSGGVAAAGTEENSSESAEADAKTIAKSAATKGTYFYIKKTVSTRLKVGLFPLYKRDSCVVNPEFKPELVGKSISTKYTFLEKREAGPPLQ
jgi:hypothetical protein